MAQRVHLFCLSDDEDAAHATTLTYLYLKQEKVFNDRHYARTGLFMNYSEEESSIWPTLRVKLRKVHFIFVIYNFVCISSRGQVGQREMLFSQKKRNILSSGDIVPIV